jgi:hypothetical protein
MINITNYPYNTLITDSPGIGLYRFRMEQLQEINLDSDLPYNDNLLGHLENEYVISDQKQIELLTSLIDPVLAEYDNRVDKEFQNILRKMQIELPPPEISDVWINRQKKHEFNPLHDHAGLYSFVLWYDIPYTSEEERIASPLIPDAMENYSGKFQYLPNHLHNAPITIHVDKTWNGTLAVFSSDTKHQVYPFYSTDKERITIAGNYGWKHLNQQ